MSGSRRSSTTQSAGSRATPRAPRAPVSDRGDVDVVVAEQFGDAQRSAALSSTTSRRLRRGFAIVVMLGQRRLQPLGRRRLGHEREGAAREAVLAVLVERDDLHRDVPRRRVLLELAEHRPAEHVGQEHIERDRRRLVFARQRERVGAAHRDQHLEAVVVRKIDEHARVVRIVLDDQQHGIAGLDASAGRRQPARPAVRPAGRRSARRDRRAAARDRRRRTTGRGRARCRSAAGRA